jgi:hypothetical protein
MKGNVVYITDYKTELIIFSQAIEPNSQKLP